MVISQLTSAKGEEERYQKVYSRFQRGNPPEGVSYDKALVWAASFVERVHSFDSGIEQFAGDKPPRCSASL
jgi:hypothetical protein